MSASVRYPGNAGVPPEDDVHLSNLEEDMGETVNLKDKYPESTAEMKDAAEKWRA